MKNNIGESKINVGNIVTLKSGGPKMTVSWMADTTAKCVWFDGLDQLNEREFVVGTLDWEFDD